MLITYKLIGQFQLQLSHYSLLSSLTGFLLLEM